jgi:hypothetical protein
MDETLWDVFHVEGRSQSFRVLTPSVTGGASVVCICSAGAVDLNSVVTDSMRVGNGATVMDTGRAKLAGLGAAVVGLVCSRT